MTEKGDVPEPEKPPPVPAIGALVRDAASDKVGEFRGTWAGKWALRPIKGGVEWEADPRDVHAVTPEQRMHAEVGKANARSRGEVL
ncbi:hypothetical protein IAG44_20100 [Streptomyces roseirectus]|uniref:Uncharacterized protein n=1 Tax=Streptomyces roseirectus TaxID=2768066 RepID=A0A7H0IFD8_9ACTN|nr:hypothetical protein [Streptomyces roseirectus]QNP71504.1 hypothetical protein IAG44_20100 [Streptomyces roseirectus]